MSDREGPNPYQSPAEGEPALPAAASLWPLFILFGSLYFVQGVVEPTAGMIFQPIQSQLQDWNYSPASISAMFAFIGIPWSLKLLFGLVSDFFPVFGRRRRPYLVFSTVAAATLFAGISFGWGDPAVVGSYAWVLMLICGAVAMTDVVIDALAVETGQPLRITGQLQSVQWGAMSAASILGGLLGGVIAGYRVLGPALLGCGLLCGLSLIVVLIVVREPRRQHVPVENLRLAFQALTTRGRFLILLSAGIYLFLWNFNPFSSNVLLHYSTEVLGFSDPFYGALNSIQAAAQAVACAGYFLVCRRIPFGWLIHGSILAGILSTLCYWPMRDATTAIFASIAFGLTYQIATLIQLDLAARIAPTEAAGTIFALLMAISNTGITASTWVSGAWYDWLASAEGLGSRHAAFDSLVAIGAAFTAACWLVVPVMKWAGVEWR
ncbi:MAG TPA: MFS transporter [Pirellulaceae bacterium]|nr:MFS transporter [Pirellulaceae bacterium]